MCYFLIPSWNKERWKETLNFAIHLLYFFCLTSYNCAVNIFTQSTHRTILLCIVSRSKIRGSGCWRCWQVTGDMWHVTWDMWHGTFDMGHVTWDMWHGTCDMGHVTWDMWHMACDQGLANTAAPCQSGTTNCQKVILKKHQRKITFKYRYYIVMKVYHLGTSYLCS